MVTRIVPLVRVLGVLLIACAAMLLLGTTLTDTHWFRWTTTGGPQCIYIDANENKQQDVDGTEPCLGGPATLTAGTGANLRGVVDIVNDAGCDPTGGATVDDLPCLQNAINAMTPATTCSGGGVLHGHGDFYISDTLLLPACTVLEGTARSRFKILAHDSFPQDGTPMIDLESSDVAGAHGARLHRVHVDGRGLAKVGIYSDEVQESGGATETLIYSVDLYGVHFEGTAQNYVLRDIEVVLSSAADADAYGVRVEATADPARAFDSFSITPGDQGTDVHCVYIGTVGTKLTNLHCEAKGNAVKVPDAVSAVVLAQIDHRGTTGDNGACSVDVGPNSNVFISGLFRPPATTGCLIFERTRNLKWFSGQAPPAGHRRGGAFAVLGQAQSGMMQTFVLEDTNLAGNPSATAEDFFRPRIRDSLTWTPQADALQTCATAIEGTSYYDGELNKMCVCSNRSGSFVWESLDGVDVGSATDCG